MSDTDNRKDLRRDHIKRKKLDKDSKNTEARDRQRMKKQFKQNIEEMRQSELWEEWEDEVH
jgi:hypothetical protein